ncbi:MAG TPA: DUF4436 family protein, partial [Candidatus Angelobacter sp.]|nr:DUF4436 family protein [Candidatus Angelobacter sp.]
MALKRRTWLGVVIVLAFLAAYFTALLGNITERSRRSLELRDEVAAADRALVSIQVIKIDPAARQLTARLRFRVYGDLAQDTMTPKLNLKLLTNNSPGQHVFEFPEGSGMVRIEATFPLEGDANRYPFDRYESTVLLFMDTPRPSNKPQAPKVQPSEPEVPEPQAPDV